MNEDGFDDELYAEMWGWRFGEPGEPSCPICTADAYDCGWRGRFPRFRCKNNHDFTMTSGTIFNSCKLPLSTLGRIIVALRAAPSMRACELKEIAEIDYRSAWQILRKWKASSGRPFPDA